MTAWLGNNIAVLFSLDVNDNFRIRRMQIVANKPDRVLISLTTGNDAGDSRTVLRNPYHRVEFLVTGRQYGDPAFLHSFEYFRFSDQNSVTSIIAMVGCMTVSDTGNNTDMRFGQQGFSSYNIRTHQR